MPLCDGPNADEMIGHSLAALDAHWVFLAANAAAGHEAGLRRFATVLRSLPDGPATPLGPAAGADAKLFGIAVRRVNDQASTFFEFANDSPYLIRVAGLLTGPNSAPVEDLGRGVRLSPLAEGAGRKLVLDLLPFGVAAIRVGAPQTSISAVTPYPSEAVLADMQARFNELSVQLARLNRGLAAVATEPANPGFEPEGNAEKGVPKAADAGERSPERPGGTMAPVGALGGWKVEGGPSGAGTVAIDGANPHAGQGSLRFTAAAGPVSVVSDSFVPNVQSSLTVQVFVRARCARHQDSRLDRRGIGRTAVCSAHRA